MDWYSFTKLIHVTAAVLWVGGGFTLFMIGLTAQRAADLDGQMKSMQATADLGNRLMVPASVLTLLSGLTMCWFWIGFSDLWIVIGLAGFATTFLIGTFVFKPTSERVSAIIAQSGMSPAAIQEGKRIMKFARFDYSVMLVVVTAMVLKPTSSDTIVLTAMAATLAIGVAAAFGSWGEPKEAQV